MDARARAHLQQSESEHDKLPQPPRANELDLSPHAQAKLKELREKAVSQAIQPEQLFVVGDDPTFRNGIHAGEIWYQSLATKNFVTRTIPRANTAGGKRENEFVDCLSDDVIDNLKPLPDYEFDTLEFIMDLSIYGTDAPLLAYLLIGAPLSYCGPFTSFLQKNHYLPPIVLKKLYQTRREDQATGRVSQDMSRSQVASKFPAAHRSSPLGAVPHNSEERLKQRQGIEDIRYRAIFDASLPDPDGTSVNAFSTFATMHKVEFTRLTDFENALIDADTRLIDIGFISEDSRIGRINVMKTDQKSAYRTQRIHPSDEWLSLSGLQSTTGSSDQIATWVSDRSLQFGQRAAVTIYSRFAYGLSSFFSQDQWDQIFFPEMSIKYKEGESANNKPTASALEKRLIPFRPCDGLSGDFP